MKLVFSYLKATKHASLFPGWELNGVGERGEPINFYISHIKNKPEPDLTYFEAESVTCELEGNMLILLDEKIVPSSCRKDWEYDPDQPRNLAKTVTVK